MCDCDCELPKAERWRQIREEAMERHVAVPRQGEWYVKDGKVVRINETDLIDTNSEYWKYEMWIDAPEDDDG